MPSPGVSSDAPADAHVGDRPSRHEAASARTPTLAIVRIRVVE
jgi:hypothetical protein